MTAAGRPSLLFVSPAVPSPTGGGLRMRAWQFLVAAARGHRVTLVAGSPHFPDEDRAPLDDVMPLVERVLVLPWRSNGIADLFARKVLTALRSAASATEPLAWAAPTSAMRGPLAVLRAQPFDRTHVFRLYMLPLALEILDGDASAVTWLDLDDWDSATHRTIARLPTLSVARRRAFALEAERFAAAEVAWLPHLRTVLVASEDDRRALAGRYGTAAIRCIENAVAVAEADRPRGPGSDPALLFIGSLGYAPNDDAIRFFLGEIWPGALEAVPRLRLRIVGGGAPRALRRLLRGAVGVDAPGAVASVAAAYSGVTAAILPLRAGGGTRLKALEAFALGCPLISTAVGVAGLDVEPGIHYQPAESPEEWRRAVVADCASPPMAAQRARAALRWLGGRSFAVVTARIERLLHGSG